MEFRTVLELGGKTATGLVVPDDVVDRLGRSRKPAVVVTINGHSYRSTVASRGGRYLIPVSAEIRRITGLTAGDEVDVTVEIDDAPRTVAVPPDLAARLDSQPEARRAFDALAYSHQLAHVLAIDGAKTPETRQRRLDKTLEALLAGNTD
jgi:bifunctional DNA-binding transcriptional regulator/antitoxin component of YhaV-PrlF toxin-antitoxin module